MNIFAIGEVVCMRGQDVLMTVEDYSSCDACGREAVDVAWFDDVGELNRDTFDVAMLYSVEEE